MLSDAALREAADEDLTRKFAVAATTFLVYDMLIHIEDEVEYIWSQHVWIKLLYVLIRHLPYLVQGTILVLHFGSAWHPVQCRDWLIYEASYNEGLTIAVEAILVVRVYAMYRQHKYLITVVLLLFVGEVVSMITILALSAPKTEFTSRCIVTQTPAIFTSYWILSLTFETVLFALTLVKFFTGMNWTLGRRSIMYVLVRDGIWAFGVIFLIMLTNTLMYHSIHNTLTGLCFYWELSIMSFAGSHVLLNLRRFGARSAQSSNPLLTAATDTVLSSSPMMFWDRPLSQLSTCEDRMSMELHETYSLPTTLPQPDVAFESMCSAVHAPGRVSSVSTPPV